MKSNRLTDLGRVALGFCLAAVVATSAAAFSVKDRNTSGGCCCDYQFCTLEMCNGPGDCTLSGDDCCAIACCY